MYNCVYLRCNRRDDWMMTLLTFKSSSNSLDRFLKLIMWGWLRFFFFVMSIYTFVKYDLLAHTKLGPEKTSLIMLLSFAHRCHGGVASTASNPPSCRRDVWEVGRPAAAVAPRPRPWLRCLASCCCCSCTIIIFLMMLRQNQPEPA